MTVERWSRQSQIQTRSKCAYWKVLDVRRVCPMCHENVKGEAELLKKLGGDDPRVNRFHDER